MVDQSKEQTQNTKNHSYKIVAFRVLAFLYSPINFIPNGQRDIPSNLYSTALSFRNQRSLHHHPIQYPNAYTQLHRMHLMQHIKVSSFIASKKSNWSTTKTRSSARDQCDRHKPFQLRSCTIDSSTPTINPDLHDLSAEFSRPIDNWIAHANQYPRDRTAWGYIIIDRVIACVKCQTMTTGDSVTLSSLYRDS